MTWVRIDDNAPLHPKLLDAGPEAAWMWTCGLAHCNRHHTDGRIAARHLATLYPGHWSPARCTELAERLVEVRLWDADGPDYRVHNYERYQAEATKEAVEIRREYERKKKADQRARKKGPTAPGGTVADVPDTSRTRPGQVPGHVPEMSPGTNGGHVPGTGGGHPPGTGAGDAPSGGTSLSPPPDPSRPVPTPERNSSSVAPAALSTAKGSNAKAAPKDPPPFTVGAAFEAVATAARGRFVAGVERDWTQGVRISVAKHVRAYPELGMWSRLGRWLAAGGDSFRGALGPSWAASNALPDAMARAAAWEAQGCPPVAARGNASSPHATPSRTRPTTPPRPRHSPEEEQQLLALALDEQRRINASLNGSPPATKEPNDVR